MAVEWLSLAQLGVEHSLFGKLSTNRSAGQFPHPKELRPWTFGYLEIGSLTPEPIKQTWEFTYVHTNLKIRLKQKEHTSSESTT